MRQITIALNSVVAVFFVIFLAYTFVARQHLEGLARGFVTEKTLQYAKPMVEIAEEAMRSQIVQRLLTDDQTIAIRKEITQFKQDPSAYIADLTRQIRLSPAPKQFNPLLKKVTAIKERIRTFYDNTLTALIVDLRIFASSNLCASIIAFCLAYWSPQRFRKSIVWFSFLMFASLIYCSYLYVDGLTFFRIMFRTHMGWLYPVFVCVALVGLYLEYGRAREIAEQDDGEERASDL